MTGLVQIDALVDQADPFSLSLDELNRLIAEINEIGACALADWCSGIRDLTAFTCPSIIEKKKVS